MSFETEEVTIRKQKMLLERKICSAANAQTKILVYGALNGYDTHKIEEVLDNLLDVKCNAVKSDEDPELAVLLLSRATDLTTILQHNKTLLVAKNTWYFEPYCEHLLKMVNIPIGAKSVHISSALASISTDYKLVYYNDKTGYVHCASQDSKEKLLLRNTLSLLVANAPVKNDVPASNKSVPKPKPDPLPVMQVGTTAAFKDSNEFVSVIGGNGVTEITFLHKGNLSRVQAKGFSRISAICDTKAIKCTIIDGSRMQLSTALPKDVKEVMDAIRDQLLNREADCVNIGEVEKIYVPIFKMMAKLTTSASNCVVTAHEKPGKLNNQLDFVTLFLFGFRADVDALKQVLSTLKHPCSQEFTLSNDDAKLLAEMPEAIEAIKNQFYVDFVFENKVRVRALSRQLLDQAWQAALAELKQRKDAAKLSYPHCIIDYFDNYMRSDFQKEMFQKQLAGVTIISRGDKLIFNGPNTVVDKVKTELQQRLDMIKSQKWPEQIDVDLARHVFSTKKIQQILRENEVSYFFFGKTRNVQESEKKPNRNTNKPVNHANNNASPKKNKEWDANQKANIKKSNSNIKKSNKNNNNSNKNHNRNKNSKLNKNNREKKAPHHLTRYYEKNSALRDISFACQDTKKLTSCIERLKAVLTVQSAPLDVNFGLTRFIIQNIKDIESKYKVIVRKNPYTNSANASQSNDSDTDSESGDESDSDDSDMSDAQSNASSDASDGPKKIQNQCYVTGMARNTIKAINYIKEYEKNLSWRQAFKLPTLQFKYIEAFKKTEVKMLCKKFNVEAVWPVHSVRPPLLSSKFNHKVQKQPVGQRNMLLIKGKKGDVEGVMKELNTIAQGLFEKRVQVPSTIPLPLLLLEKEENVSKFNIIVTIIKAKTATSTSDDISDNDSEDDEDTAQNQSQHTVVVVGSDYTVVSNACNVMSGPYVIENPNYTPQQFGLLFKELVQQNTKKNFQSENTVFVTLEKISAKVTLYGRKANVDAALNSLQIRLNGKFLVETLTVPKDFDILMKAKNITLFDRRLQGAKAFFKKKDGQMELTITGDRNNVVALKSKLEDLLATIKKDLYTVTNSAYAWRYVLATDFCMTLTKFNVLLDTEAKPASYDRGSIHLVNDVVIHLKRGDIFNETGSAIVSCDNEDMKPIGGIAKSIADRTGPSMQREVNDYLACFGKLMVGSAMTTNAGNLYQSFATVIHVVGPIWSGGNANEHNLLCSAVRSIIDQAARNKLTKIVMPSISTGVFSYPKKMAAEVIAKELVQSVSHNTTFIKEIVFVDMDEEIIEELRMQFEKLHNNANTKTYIEAKNQWYWREDNGVYMPYDADQNNQIELAFQTKQSSVQVVGDLNQIKNGSNYEVNFKLMKQRNLVTNWQRDVTYALKTADKWVKLEAHSLQASAGLIKKIHLHAITSKSDVVKITGSRSDVNRAVQEIENHIASLTKMVTIDWRGGLPDANQTKFLESIGVTSSVDKRKLILRGFSDALNQAQLHLMQQAMQIVKYPDTWDDQTQNCQLFAVDAQSQEWATVTSAFRVTMPNVQIVKVERIQNKIIWEDYLGHVQKLNKTTGNTTQLQLFHGTRNTDPKLIYTDSVGFRNQFSSPQCYWGYGNYFAVNSSYSHSYAHYLPNGHKQMFLATVLVGDCYPAGSQTDQSLRVPPFKPAQNGAQQVRYDSVQGYTGGSTVYILYDPSYLITYN